MQMKHVRLFPVWALMDRVTGKVLFAVYFNHLGYISKSRTVELYDICNFMIFVTFGELFS